MTTGIIVLIVVGIFAGLLVAYYNSFIAKRNMAEQAFSTIDVMLKKRSDLIPNLVASVQEYMRHESGTFTRIAELRARAGNEKLDTDKRVEANNELNRLVGNLLVQVENYPELKANDNVMQLQTSLTNMEEQLSAARRAYNAAIVSFNNSIEMFPGNILASIYGFKRRALLEIAPEDRKNPDVHALFKR